MRAEIVSIGTELLLGSITDTNASYLAQRLADLGIDCYYISQVGDNQARIVETLQRALERSDLTITTGGLGPTGDDLTRESIAALLAEAPFVDAQLEEKLRAFFARRRVPMPERNLKQATLIPSARTLNNPVGTAPGCLVRHQEAGLGDRYIVAMPGVPFEMKRMWEEEVEPWLRPLSPMSLVSRTLKIIGLGESAIDEAVADLMTGSNPTLAPYAKQDGVHLRITAKAASQDAATQMIGQVEEEVRRRLGDAIYGADKDTPSRVVARLLAETGLRIAIVEIGKGAVGALSALLSDSRGLIGGVFGSSLDEASSLLAPDSDEWSIEEVSRSIIARTGADLCLALVVRQEFAASGDSVRAVADISLTSSERLDGDRTTPARFEWTTAGGEVSRLAGLATLNILRKWLLAHGSRMRQLNEV